MADKNSIYYLNLNKILKIRSRKKSSLKKKKKKLYPFIPLCRFFPCSRRTEKSHSRAATTASTESSPTSAGFLHLPTPAGVSPQLRHSAPGSRRSAAQCRGSEGGTLRGRAEGRRAAAARAASRVSRSTCRSQCCSNRPLPVGKSWE